MYLDNFSANFVSITFSLTWWKLRVMVYRVSKPKIDTFKSNNSRKEYLEPQNLNIQAQNRELRLK